MMAKPNETLDSVLARRVRELRDEKGFTQEKLAQRMSELGFAWQRVTVAEVEGSQKRRVSIDEWVGLASAFGVSAITLLETPKGSKIDVSPGLSGLSVFQLLLLIAGREALERWESQISTESAVAGAGAAFDQVLAEFEKPIAAMHKLVEAFDVRMETLQRAAAFGDLALAKKGDASK
jgi:transcriptional regulator with XRE-family HTH domain